MLRQAAVAIGLVLAGTAAGQDGPKLEIGTMAGVSIQSAGGSSVTLIGIPGGGILGQPVIYASIFATPRLIVEPQIAMNVISSSGNTATTVGLGAQFAYLFGAQPAAPYVAGNLAYQSVSGGGSSDSDFAPGGAVGYRFPLGTGGIALRVEGRFRRWIDSELNDFGVVVGLGGVLSR